MCGRFTLTIPSYEDLAAALGVDPAPGAADLFRPRYNIAPTDSTWVVRLGAERQRELALLEWGLVPRWSKTLMQAGRPINARAETLEKKPVFRESLERRRCVVASDGFFEWDKSGPVKQPLWFRPANGGLLLLGGLWDSWRTEEGTRRQTFTIVTTAPNREVAPVHDRMPLVLAERDVDTWLDVPPRGAPTAIPDSIRTLIRSAPDGSLVPTLVSKRVGSVKNDDPSILLPDAPVTSVGENLSLFDLPAAAGTRRKR